MIELPLCEAHYREIQFVRKVELVPIQMALPVGLFFLVSDKLRIKYILAKDDEPCRLCRAHCKKHRIHAPKCKNCVKLEEK